MLPGWEEETKPLTDAEFAMVPLFVESFEQHIGKDQAVSANTIVERLTKLGKKINDVRVRKIVNYLRRYNVVSCLLGNSKGYYIAEYEDDMQRHDDSIQGRIDSMIDVRDEMRKQKRIRFPVPKEPDKNKQAQFPGMAGPPIHHI